MTPLNSMSRTMKVLAITGFKRNGKDTVASFIHDYLGTKGKISESHAFASSLKQEVVDGYGCSLEYLEANKSIFRGLLQNWGSCRRELLGKDYWINKLKVKLATISSAVDLLIITDLRHLNEEEFIKSIGGKILRIERQLDSPFDLHESEIHIPDIKYDAYISNRDLTLDGLRNEAIRVVTELELIK